MEVHPTLGETTMRRLTGKGIGKDKTIDYVTYEFDSLNEYIAASEANASQDGASHRGPGDYGRGFFVHKTHAQACEVAREGWAAVRPDVDVTLTMLREKLADIIQPTNVRVHDITGFEPDIDRYVSGELECMWDDMVIESPHNGKVLTLILDTALSAYMDKDVMCARGAAVIALVEAFDMCGFQLEIWCEHTCGSSRTSTTDLFSELVCIARAGEPLDINAVMFPLGNTDYRRRIGFGFDEGTQEAHKFGFSGSNGYGIPRKGVHHAERLGASMVLSLEGSGRTIDVDPIRWIVGQLEDQGIVIGDD
jgi:hypothetical protein